MAIDFLRPLTRHLFVSCVALGCVATSTGASEPSEAQTALVRYVWYDLDKPRDVWLNPSLAAKIGAAAETETVGTSRSLAGLRLAANVPGTTYAADRLPVFHAQASEHSAPLVLTAAIIIYLDPGWPKTTALKWLADRDLEVIRALPVRANAFLIESKPGLATLQLANALYESGVVLAAFPDWWRAHALR